MRAMQHGHDLVALLAVTAPFTTVKFGAFNQNIAFASLLDADTPKLVLGQIPTR